MHVPFCGALVILVNCVHEEFVCVSTSFVVVTVGFSK